MLVIWVELIWAIRAASDDLSAASSINAPAWVFPAHELNAVYSNSGIFLSFTFPSSFALLFGKDYKLVGFGQEPSPLPFLQGSPGLPL